ncbi:MAG: Diaminopimelate decarboxylase [Deltaproteobacteria bacterium ADurb.Bin510]|nr:MAG: Diaminopimelate decarboxylase [Deltaproteobacteria bacterium ADurb.Bin510]
MNDFVYKEGSLHCGDVDLERIASEVGTPFYCYSLPTVRRHVRAFEEPLKGIAHQTCFAMKANASQALLKAMADEGLGADVVSGGELYRALKAGIPGSRIVYSGVGKTVAEIDAAIAASILMFNIESIEEMEVINQRALAAGKRVPIAIRVNPDVDPKTHPYISTGMKKNKFGIDIENAIKQYERASQMAGLEIVGIDCHIGSQLTEISPFVDAIERLKLMITRLSELGIELKYLDLGGGLGITYSDEEPPLPGDYHKAILDAVSDLKLKLIFEPGRVLVGNAGILVTQVLYRKQAASKTFIIVDAGMNDLARPSLYDAYHDIRPVKVKPETTEKVDVVGPICESSDFLARDRDLPPVEPGELLAVMSAGAYGYTMSSNYNSRPRVAEVLVDGDCFAVVNQRQTYADLIAGETIPDFLK